MRVLIYSYNYHPEPIGIAPLMTELAEGLVQRGHEVRVVTGMPNYPQRQIYPDYCGKLYLTEQRYGVSIQRSYVWIKPKPNLLDRILLDASFIFTSFLQAIRGWRPDVILVTVPPLPVCLPAAILGWLYQCPIILNVQDILPEAAIKVGLLRNPGMIWIMEQLERFAYRSAQRVSVIAEGFLDNLVQKDVPPNKIVHIPNWVDINFIWPIPRHQNSFCAEHGLENQFVVLYAGNIALTQGLETVVEAATRLEQQPDITIVIVGESMALADLQQYCQVYRTTNVRLLPLQPRQRLPELLAAADVGLVVQRRNVVSFNMPSKIQVLLASGRAIVASVPPTGSAAQTVTKSRGGIVVEPENAEALAASILDLYHNPIKTELLGQQGRQFAVERFSFEQALNQYESLFDEVTDKMQLLQTTAALQAKKSAANI